MPTQTNAPKGVIDKLVTELTDNPEGRGYDAMTDEQVKDDLNEQRYEGDVNINDLHTYIIYEKYRTNTGTDTGPANIIGRINILAAASPETDPFGVGSNVTVREVAAANAFKCYMETGAGVLFSDTRMDDILNILQGICFNAADKTAITALGNNKRSRGMIIEATARVRTGWVQAAREQMTP